MSESKCDEHDPCEGNALHIRARDAKGCAQFQDGSWFTKNRDVCRGPHLGLGGDGTPRCDGAGGGGMTDDVRLDALDHHAGWCSCADKGWLAARTLDEAWREAEVAMPDGWRLHLRTVPRHSTGVNHLPHGYSAAATSRDIVQLSSGLHETPVAALLTLVARLAEAKENR